MTKKFIKMPKYLKKSIEIALKSKKCHDIIQKYAKFST